MTAKRQSYTTWASDSKKSKISTPTHIKNYELDLIKTPGLWTNAPLENSISIREIKRLWELPDAPLTPKRWDIYFDTKLRKLLVYETRRFFWDRDKYAVDGRITGNTYKVWDYVEVAPYLYECINDHVSVAFPDPTNWIASNVIRRWVPLDWSMTTQILWANQTIPSWTLTKLNYNLFYGNRWNAMINAGDMTIDTPWTYIIIAYTNRITDTNDTQRKTRILINWIPVQEDTANSARVSVTTVGTDSVWWSINATSTVNYSLEPAQNNPVLIRDLSVGDIITVEVWHNKGANTDVLQDSYLQVKQI